MKIFDQVMFSSKDFLCGLFAGTAGSLFMTGVGFGMTGQTTTAALFFFIAGPCAIAATIIDYMW